MTSEQVYYVAVNGQKTGPFSINELKTQNIKRDTLVWTEGLSEWTKAEFIPALKELFKAMPPPVPGSETKSSYQQAPPPPPYGGSDQKYFGYQLARRRERLFATILETIIIVVPLFLLFGEGIFEGDPYSLSSIIGGAIISAIFGAVFYAMWGGNLGHKVMGLQVISSKDGTIQKNAKTGALRESLKNVFGLVILPLVWLLWDSDRQNLYDKVVNTYVIKKSRNW